MRRRPLGTTGLEVPVLGLGAGSLGEEDLPEPAVEELLLTALDLGITLIDSARSYGLSEARIGRHLSHRRHDLVLSSKGGYGVPGEEDWTGAAVIRGIERALQTMRTDYIDVFHLHSCPKEVAMRDDIVLALEQARDAGKIRVAGYAGEGDALGAAVRSGIFGAVECSVNLFDQASFETLLPRAAHEGVGVIAKRPLANAVGRQSGWPEGEHADYWERMHAMQLVPGADGWLDLAVRFSAFTPGVSSAIVGTSSAPHLVECAEAVERGPIAEDHRLRIETSFATKNRGWTAKV
jgi:aryl-alcohol dehydrogenase-like predicted oxidoreductase